MMLREIISTCSNAYIAEAAVASIGGEFARRFAAEAARRDLPSGALAARLVSDFAVKAEGEGLRRVVAATEGADQPILSGLRVILSDGLGGAGARGVPDETPPAWAIHACRMRRSA
jgi:hypothetical protein